ncbi:hypothetical protein [uncultured Mailhella sp.]|uniref:hypothetical protein n=1 Tax=uncultured Mailhella sp. TaxID=1981031 RepID=UPI0025EE0DB7|nr:hypothetical protein [uncultured Mailhella sp.]
MSIISVYFELPEQIKQGLATGVLSQVGGVIRETSTGKIVCFLKEVDATDKIEELSKGLEDLGAQLAGVERMQILTMGGLAGVSMICMAGFVYIGSQIANIQKQIDIVQKSLDEIKNIVNLLHVSNIVNLAKEYYRACASYQEKDYEDALKHARNCSADIENYFENMPVEKILADEKACSFLIKILCSTMQCHIFSAYLLKSKNIYDIIKRYQALFAKLETIIKSYTHKLFNSIPTSDAIQIYRLKKDPNSYLHKFMVALPVALEILDEESCFLNICSHIDRAELENKYQKNAKYLVVMNSELI